MSYPQADVQVLKVISIDDLGANIVELPSGTYLIDGEVVSHGGWNSYTTSRQISVKDVENVRTIHTRKVLVEYACTLETDTPSKLSVVEFDRAKASLLVNCTIDEDGDIDWTDLDSEFAYRKFMSMWKPVYTELTEYSEPLLIDRTHIRQDTGNPYIVAGFLTGRSDVPLYSYNRTNAVASLLAKKFESLGMEFKEGISYGATEGKKMWGNSTHSGLEYVTAFGKYIIGKDKVAKTRGEFKGSFEHLEKIYKEDKEWIENLIQVGYNLHFRNTEASSVLLSEVSSSVKTCINYVNTLEVKVKSETSKRGALAQLNKLLDLVNKEVLEN